MTTTALIAITLQPDEAVSVSIGAKIPGPPEAHALLDGGRRWRRP